MPQTGAAAGRAAERPSRGRCRRGPGAPGVGAPPRRRPSPRFPSPLAPSRPDGASLGPVPHAASPLLHASSAEAVPARPTDPRVAAAPAGGWSRRAGTGRPRPSGPARTRAAGGGRAARARGARRPAPSRSGAAFGPAGRAEQPLTGRVGGRRDRRDGGPLAVLPDQVLLADYKTGRDAARERGARRRCSTCASSRPIGRCCGRLSRPARALRPGLDARGPRQPVSDAPRPPLLDAHARALDRDA